MDDEISLFALESVRFLESGEVSQYISSSVSHVSRKLVSIEEVSRQIDNSALKTIAIRATGGLEHCACHGGLIGVVAQFDFGVAEREGHAVYKHGNCPGVYADEEDASVQTLDISCCNDIDVGEFSRWEEDVGGNVWVQDDGVGIDPPINIC